MSWQRILRFAKIRQVPVIITDETGEDPMILLSLDQLEQALDGNVGPDIPPPAPAPRSTTPSFAPEEAVAPPEEAVEEATITEAEPVDALESINVMVPPTMPAEELDLGQTPEPEIVTPIGVAPVAATSEVVSPEEEPQKPPQTPTSEMSLEERFFLEY